MEIFSQRFFLLKALPDYSEFMKKFFLLPIFVGLTFFFLPNTVNAQQKISSKGSSITYKIIKTTGKTAVVIVGTTVETAVDTGAFAAPFVLKTTEKTSIIGFDLTKFLVKKTVPVGRKLIITYLKAKLPL